MNQSRSLSSFVEQTCLIPLRGMQNSDGGWGFYESGESRVEPTAWSVLALQEFSPPNGVDAVIERGVNFLAGVQLADGSWAAAPDDREGCWVTSLACWALLRQLNRVDTLVKGLSWLSNDWPRDSTFWWRFAQKLSRDRRGINAQKVDYSGWSWTPRTASWVEPTAYALIVQQAQPASELEKSQKRCELAKAMLYDRMCPGGGWNCGNPMVYGAAGQPQVGPTVWALIALREHADHPQNRQSLDWLERNCETVRSPESLALTQIGLAAYGRNVDWASHSTRDHGFGDLPWSMQAYSWTALACSETTKWLEIAPPYGVTA